jgi:hypothetical protein
MMAGEKTLLLSSRSAKLLDWLWTRHQGHAELDVWEFTVEYFSEFFHA